MPTPLAMRAPLAALVVMPRVRAVSLLERLSACDIEAAWVPSRREARRLMASGLSVEVVLAEAILPDGSWQSLLDDVAESGLQAEVVVCVRAADRAFQCEVVQNGAYELLVEPYDTLAMVRMLQAAAARTRMRRLAAAGSNARTAA